MAHIQQFILRNNHTLKKTFSYYIMHITVAMLVAYVVTGNLWIAITLSMLEPTVQAVAFFFHEKIWAAKDKNAKQVKIRIDYSNLSFSYIKDLCSK